MFMNFWYPAETSAALGGDPIKIRIIGQDLVIFRDADGTAHCLANTCCHRGASLAGGRVLGDCLQCPYHGWQFDGDGMCRRIPSLGPNAKIPNRARVDAYPTQERYGLVFVFLGDLPEEERPPIMEIEEYEQPGWRSTLQWFEWPFNYKRSVENGIDPAHNEFVHPTHGFSGANEDYKVGPLDMRETEWGTGFFNKVLAPPLAEKRMQQESARTEAAYIDAGTGHHGVASIWTHIHPTPVMFIHQYLYEAPVDEHNTRLFLINARNFLTEPEHDERFKQRNAYVAEQDRDVLTELLPTLSPPNNITETFVASDHPIGRYREHLKDWEKRGWRIDRQAIAATRHETAYAIPSPARRVHKGWALTPVPIMTGTASS